MSNVQRLCVQCGKGNPIESRYCAACGYDSQAALPAVRSNLPAVIGSAALPVLVGAAGFIVRAGWKLLQNRLAQNNITRAPNTQPPLVPIPRDAAAPRQAKRSIHIRSSWAVNNGNGVWQQGSSEHKIEIDE